MLAFLLMTLGSAFAMIIFITSHRTVQVLFHVADTFFDDGFGDVWDIKRPLTSSVKMVEAVAAVVMLHGCVHEARQLLRGKAIHLLEEAVV
jgi:hypothetical protein